MMIVFEPPTVTDAEELLAVQIRAFHEDTRLYGVELGGPPGYDSLAVVLEEVQNDLYHKILADGKIVGGVVVFDRGGGHFHLDKIFVDPDYHNRGIGTQAMQFIEERYPANKWSLDTPTYAVRNQHFYEKLGYVRGEAFLVDDFALFPYQKHI